MEKAKVGLKVTGKILKNVLIRGTKSAIGAALLLGAVVWFKEGTDGVKQLTLDDYLEGKEEKDEKDEEEV